MNSTNFDFSSRIGARAVTAGILTTFATMMLGMMLAAGFGLWTYRLNEIPNLSGAFWIFSSAVWIVSLGVGAFVASLTGRTSTRVDGMLSGVTTWAGASVIGGSVLGMGSGWLFSFASSTVAPAMYFVGFFASIVALIVAIFTGAAGVRQEKLKFRAEPQAPRQMAA